MGDLIFCKFHIKKPQYKNFLITIVSYRRCIHGVQQPGLVVVLGVLVTAFGRIRGETGTASCSSPLSLSSSISSESLTINADKLREREKERE